MKQITYSEENEFDKEQILNLYNDAGWTNYTFNPDNLMQAIANSLYVNAAYDGDKLVGLLRAVGDAKTIIYIQDILVLQEYRKIGIGRELMKSTLDKYSSVRQIVLLTDNDPNTKAFYEKAGLQNAGSLNLISFIKLNTA